MVEAGPSRRVAGASMNGNENGDHETPGSSTSTTFTGASGLQQSGSRTAYRSNPAGDNDDSDAASSNDGEQGEEMTLAEVIKAVEVAWQNEKWTADLLVPATTEVEHLMSQIKVMERNLQTASKTLHVTKELLHAMEVNRLKFLVASYYRTRLLKVEEFCYHINAKEEERKKLAQEYREKKTTGRPPASRLMPTEQAYLTEYLHIMEGHMKNVLLRLLPPPMQKMDRAKFAKEPHLDAFVFFEAKEDREVYEPDQQIYVELRTGIKYMMRYRLISDLVEAGAVTLV